MALRRTACQSIQPHLHLTAATKRSTTTLCRSFTNTTSSSSSSSSSSNTTSPASAAPRGLYSQFFSPEVWSRLPPLFQHFHSATTNTVSSNSSIGNSPSFSTSIRSHKCTGTVECRRGSTFISRLSSLLTGMPPSLPMGTQVEVTIEQLSHSSADVVSAKEECIEEEIWTRRFTPQHEGSNHQTYTFQTRQYSENRAMVETLPLLPFLPALGSIEFVFDVQPIMRKSKSTTSNEEWNECIGFTHEMKTMRMRLFPRRNNAASSSSSTSYSSRLGGLLLSIPSFLCPTLYASTELAYFSTSSSSNGSGLLRDRQLVSVESRLPQWFFPGVVRKDSSAASSSASTSTPAAASPSRPTSSLTSEELFLSKSTSSPSSAGVHDINRSHAWLLHVSVCAMDNWLGRGLMGVKNRDLTKETLDAKKKYWKSMEISGYSGFIEAFDKPEMLDFQMKRI